MAASERPPGFSAQPSAAQHERRNEPSFDARGAGPAGTQVPPFAGPAYARFDQQPPWYQQTGPLHRNPVSRVILMAGIFAVGAAVGLTATWWMGKPADQPPERPAIRKAEPVNQAPAASAPAAAARAPGAGINPGELPYDGKPPAAGNDPVPAAIAMPAQKTDSEQTYIDIPVSAAKTKPEAEEPVTPLVTAPSAPAKTEKAAPVRTGKAPAKAQESKIAKAPQKRPAAQKTAKDGEIERIQQQADEELKKKSRNRDVTEASRAGTDETEKKAARQVKDDDPPSAAAGKGSKRAALARCEREEDSLIGREWCKWKVCNGMWGKNGCPSYERQASIQN